MGIICIRDLPEKDNISYSDYMVIEDKEDTKKVTISSLYNYLMEDVNRIKNDVYNELQLIRNIEYENSLKEKQREEAEKQRQENALKMEKDENNRANNESIRVNREKYRVSDEEDRVSSENERKAFFAQMQAQFNSMVEQFNQITQSANTMSANETARQLAENDRIVAEKERQEAYNTIQVSMLSSSDEISNIKNIYFGTDFPEDSATNSLLFITEEI